MVDITSLSVLVIGVLIGATAAGVIAHTMNYIVAIDKGVHWGILFGYVLVLTVGLSVEYGHPIVIAVTSYLGIVILGGRIFDQIKNRLPREITIQQE